MDADVKKKLLIRQVLNENVIVSGSVAASTLLPSSLSDHGQIHVHATDTELDYLVHALEILTRQGPSRWLCCEPPLAL